MELVKKTAKTVAVVTFLTVFSRALALLVSILLTAKFGVNSLTSAYSYALTITGTLVVLIGSVLTTGVVPIYIELEETKGKKDAEKFINDILMLVFLISIAIIIVGYIISPWLINFSNGANKDFSIFSLRALLPTILFMGISFVFTALLQSKNKFYPPAMVSLFSSIINIAYIAFFAKMYSVKGLVISTLIGFFIQGMSLVFPLYKTGFRYKFSFDFKSHSIKKIFALSGPLLIGVCAYQVNILTNSTIANAYDSTKFVVLSNMQNLGIQIVLTILMSVISVIYPMLSKSAVCDDQEGYKSYVHSLLSAGVIFLIPLSVVFFSQSKPIIDLVYGYGKFSTPDIILGAKIFSMYAIAIVGIAVKETCDKAFYAIKNAKTPAFVGVIIMVSNIVLSLVFIRYLGLIGVALAYSVASIIGAVCNLCALSFKIDKIILKRFLLVFTKTAAAGAAMLLCMYFLYKVDFGQEKLMQIFNLSFRVLVSTLVYIGVLYTLKTKELSQVLVLFKKRSEV